MEPDAARCDGVARGSRPGRRAQRQSGALACTTPECQAGHHNGTQLRLERRHVIRASWLTWRGRWTVSSNPARVRRLDRGSKSHTALGTRLSAWSEGGPDHDPVHAIGPARALPSGPPPLLAREGLHYHDAGSRAPGATLGCTA